MRRDILLVLVILLLVPLFSTTADSLTVKGETQVRAKPKRAPMGALLRSVAVPGWGQYYNHKYVKSAVIFTAETFFIVKAIHWWNKTEDQYKTISQTTDSKEQAARYNQYRSYRTRRDDYLWGVGLSVFLSMFDAYVDAHLAGFDIDLTPDFQPSEGETSLKLTLRF